MFFTRVAWVVAIGALAFGALLIVAGLTIAQGMMGPAEEALPRYFPHLPSTGAVIDKGIYTILFAIALGTLAEIRLVLRKL
jgi:hypothetical protein